MLVAGTFTKPVSQVRSMFPLILPIFLPWPQAKTRQASLVNVIALFANVFAAATNKTNIHNKTGSTCH